MNKITIPEGTTLEDIKLRKKIIKNFYAIWNAANPTKQVFNSNLKEFINVRFLSIQETSLIAANKYSSTFALINYFTEILELAEEIRAQSENRVGRVSLPPKNND